MKKILLFALTAMFAAACSQDAIVETAYQQGMMISIDETSKKWNDANSWCSNYGSGWYLPSIDEFTTIYTMKSYINSALSTLGKTTISGNYWSSAHYESGNYYCYNMNSGYSDVTYHTNTRKVRAVHKF